MEHEREKNELLQLAAVAKRALRIVEMRTRCHWTKEFIRSEMAKHPVLGSGERLPCISDMSTERMTVSVLPTGSFCVATDEIEAVFSSDCPLSMVRALINFQRS